MTVVLDPDHAPHGETPPTGRPVLRSMFRGFRRRCPSCATGRLYGAFLKIAPACGHCGEELHHHQADDAPPYFTIFAVGHIVVPLVLWLEMTLRPPIWAHLAIWLPLTLALAVLLLPPIKGSVVGLQWALGMHGFEAGARGDRTS